MDKKLLIGIGVGVAVAAAAAAFMLRPDAEAKAAGKLRECWEARTSDPQRRCLDETRQYMQACQQRATQAVCVDKVGKILQRR